jgi:PAS domain S-box-containing protein
VGETGREVLYNHVQRDAPYTADPYLSLHRPKSVLCLPIQFSDTRMGFLYLENKHLAGAFTVNHMDFIRSMAAHIIVGLENAMLYTRLFESERLLKTSQQIAHVGSWQYDIARDHLVWSDEVFNIFGIERDKFDGTFSSFSSMVHPEDAAQIERVMNNFDVIKKRGERLVHRIIRPSGEVRWLEEKFEVFHEGGKAVRTLGMVLDITEQKMAEEQLRVSENKYRHLYESIDDAFVLTDVSGAILQSNKAFQEMVQYTPSDLAQMNLKDLTPERWHGLDEEIVKKRLLPEGRADLYEKELICKDGALLPVELQLFYVRLNGDKRGFIGAIIRDISKRRVYEHVLVQARLAAERASRAKSDFIAHVSHELKTPLNGVLGFAQILVASERDDKRKKHLETIRDSGKHLLNIIDNILDLTRLEAGALPVQFKPLEVETLVNEVEAILGDMIRGKGLEFNIDVDVKKDRFWGDWVKIKQILINLIGNAMKFTAQGRISLKARLEPGSTPGVSRLAFSVTDTGVGMTSDQQKHLFAKFSNFGTVVQGKIASGTGLGLAIVKNLVDLIGGQIEVESVVGRGTEVKVLLPVKNSEPEGPSDLGGGEAMGRVSSLFRPELKGKKVLVAEDSEVNQAFMEVLLSEIGVTCDMASNGQEAAERVKSDSYDLILMDIQMPVMNGYEAASSIRKSGAALPIVALTAYSDVENKEKAQANGMNDFLAKPVDIASLVKVLKKWALGST